MFGIKVTSVLQTLLWLMIRVALACFSYFTLLWVLAFFFPDCCGPRGIARAYETPAGRTTLFLFVLGTLTSLVLLYKLVAIVETAEKGDPFTLENASRLRSIAWAVFIVEGLRGAVQWIGYVEFPWPFPLWSLLMVLLLFALARVFEQGAKMREEIGEMI